MILENRTMRARLIGPSCMRAAVSQQLKNGGVAPATVVEATRPHQQSFHVGRRPVIPEILQTLHIRSACCIMNQTYEKERLPVSASRQMPNPAELARAC